MRVISKRSFPEVRMTLTSKINCSICNKPVDLSTAKTDDKGQAVHAECYVLAVVLQITHTPGNQQPAS